MALKRIQCEIQHEHAMLSEKLSVLRGHCVALSSCRGDCTCDEVAKLACADQIVTDIGDLLNYMVEHFRHEETLMKDFGLHRIAPKLFGEHVEAHATMSEALSELVGALEEHDPYPHLTGLINFVAGWLHDHVANQDEALLQALQNPAWAVSLR